ncbi:helix-turn-helix domain-containing protein [Arthrobacter sp. H35-D1]|uniref:ArsR/SmtB family transcription factor n=1 Tax=Arthrobacter sp. H35-D1 TaxID=3046202 RepID=UPI0024B994EE|nr:helix-turn-helix domain-containing protein [Arthrobacter sp. H35-D1]MDJ0314290.1 helix-turn-helix domain-containing protein [Arthrobacter sp. H35-D1]
MNISGEQPKCGSSDQPRPPGPEYPVQTITDAKALSAMANPFRSRMLDVLYVDGPSTASGLAQRTGQAVGSVSHHLKVLSAAGLIEEAPELAKDRRERWWRLIAPGTRWSRTEFANDPGAVTAALAAESLSLHRQNQRARDWLANAGTAGEWDSAAFSTQTWAKMTPAELQELSQELIVLIQKWRFRDIPNDGQERESVYIYAHGFPAQP